MVRAEIVHKFMSWFGRVPTFESTPASVKTSNSENFINCTGLFGFEELKEPNGLYLIQKNAFRKAKILIQEIKNEEHKCNLAIVCDELIDTLYRVIDLARFIMCMVPEKKFGDVAKRVYLDSRKFLNKVYADREFYYFFKKAAKDKNHVLEREPFDSCVIDSFLHQLKGRHLFFDEKEKEIEKLKEKLAKYFHPPISHPPTSWLGYLYWLYLNEYDSSYKLLHKLLCRKLELAELKGFSTYGDFALRGSIAGTPDFVMQFLLSLNKLVKPEIDRDLQDVIQHKKFSCKMEALKCLISKSKKEFSNPESHVKDYFSLDVCMDGLKLILSSLYDIILDKIEDKDILKGELWHDDVEKYCIQQGNEILGYIYFDFFGRCNKAIRTFLIQTSRMSENGTYQTPVVVISLSFTKPVVSEPVLLDLCDVNNLFLQMGSVMHDILEQNKYGLLCRDTCPIDLFHVPSHLMSYFAYDSRVLQKFAKHYRTQEVIPDDIIKYLQNCTKKYYFHKSQKMIFDSLVDQYCHCVEPESLSFSKAFSETRNEIFGMSDKSLTFCQEEECIYLVSEAKALNYSSLMSKAIASLIWQKYFKNDPLSHVAGEKYRNEFLAQGGLMQPRFLVESYLQMELTPKVLAKAFVKQFLSPL